MSENPAATDDIDPEYLQVVHTIVTLRQAAFKQLVWGSLWWLGSSIAMYVALQSTGSTTYWYGGALGALFHWFRAFKLISATWPAGAKKLVKREGLTIAAAGLMVVFSISTIVPEYFRIQTPTVGTCWADTGNGGGYVPVACWAPSVVAKTIGFADSVANCPVEADKDFPPDATDDRYTCLKSQ